MGRYHFSTVASAFYFYKSIVLYNTLKHHTKDFTLHVLCMDDEAYHLFKKTKYENIIPIHLSEIEDSMLKKARNDRSYHEYCWTVKSAMLHYVMNNNKSAEYYGHLDADLCMFDDIGKLYSEAPEAPLYLTDHNNSKKFLYTYNLTGRFNTGFVGCRNCPEAFCAVNWWREKSIEWCYNKTDTANRLYGDQRYVERWPEMFQHVHVVRTTGANVAVWNVEDYKVHLIDNTVYINNDRLIFYHFSGLSILGPREYNLSWFQFTNHNAVEYIYKPYMYLLNQTIEKIREIAPGFNKGFVKQNEIAVKHYYGI